MRTDTISAIDKGILLRCPNTACGHHEWRYKGKMKICALCPDCRRPVKIAENKVH